VAVRPATATPSHYPTGCWDVENRYVGWNVYDPRAGAMRGRCSFYSDAPSGVADLLQFALVVIHADQELIIRGRQNFSQAHNLKVIGSNPIRDLSLLSGLFKQVRSLTNGSSWQILGIPLSELGCPPVREQGLPVGIVMLRIPDSNLRLQGSSSPEDRGLRFAGDSAV
jgi:hypothetical protein